MKSILPSIAIMMSLSSSLALAQIPVTDVGSITTQVTNQIETMAKWKLQYDQMMAQINQAKRQYESLTGSRNLGTIMNDPALRDYLPPNWKSVYDGVRNGGYSGLDARGKSIYDENKAFDSCAHISVPDQRTACEAGAARPAQNKAFALDAYEAARSRINQIDQLMRKINDTQDPKAMAELQGRIAAEQANIHNEQIKLQLYEMAVAAEEKLHAQRQREIQARTWSSRKGIQVAPLTFN
ncbi:MAG TPA: P-type DNA transfer protein VirB5 [Oligoflexus sp.]|uniref:P-type DNA transfer protein VirB5 n=1 Tax=Oligoflexus sp. TaxID=1971216 RepID=UPI002D7F0157|nr:P-type DNA transfer protein VirB5 [Oligoflexus sp.]HET9239205.1 P-type DNA transfer protein VirB5 [Oligoflexus sp.]